MSRDIMAAALLFLLATGAAQGDVFGVPGENPVLTVDVPGSWRPNHSEDGIDAAAPDNSLFFSIYTATAGGAAAVQSESLEILSRNGMKIEKTAALVRSVSFGGLNWDESQYSAMEDGKPRQVRLDAAHLSGKTFVQLLVWGSPKGMEKNSVALEKIFKTIKLKGR